MKISFRHIFLSVLATVVLFAFLELLARWYGYRPMGQEVLDQHLGWALRQPTHTLNPHPESAELLLLGNSLTVIYDLKSPSFTKILHDEGFQVINFSAIGYGTDQAYLYLKEHLAEVPKVKNVVLQFSLFTDILLNASPVNPFDGARQKPYFTVDNGGAVLHQDHIRYKPVDVVLSNLRNRFGVVYFLNRIFQMAHPHFKDLSGQNSAVESVKQLRVKVKSSDPAPTSSEWQEYYNLWKKGLPVTRAVLSELEVLVSQTMKARLLILLHPTSYNYPARDPLELSPEQRDYFSSLHLEIYDLGCFYRAIGVAYGDIATDRAGHLTEHGHELVAQKIEEYTRNKITHPECFIK